MNTTDKESADFNLKWERLGLTTYRLRVYGGWMVTTNSTQNNCVAESSIFIPDPLHFWTVDNDE